MSCKNILSYGFHGNQIIMVIIDRRECLPRLILWQNRDSELGFRHDEGHTSKNSNTPPRRFAFVGTAFSPLAKTYTYAIRQPTIRTNKLPKETRIKACAGTWDVTMVLITSPSCQVQPKTCQDRSNASYSSMTGISSDNLELNYAIRNMK